MIEFTTPPTARPSSAEYTPVFTWNSRTATCDVEYPARVRPRSSPKNAWLSSTPSICTLFSTAGIARKLIRPNPDASLVTPGVVNASELHRRLLIGIFSISRLLSCPPNAGESNWITGCSAVTSTATVVSPVVRCGRSSVTWFTATITPVCFTLLKPVAVIVTVYVPGCSKGALNSPLDPAFTVRSAPVPSLCTSTLAFGSTASVASNTVPEIEPDVIDCARTPAVITAAAEATNATLLVHLDLYMYLSQIPEPFVCASRCVTVPGPGFIQLAYPPAPRLHARRPADSFLSIPPLNRAFMNTRRKFPHSPALS